MRRMKVDHIWAPVNSTQHLSAYDPWTSIHHRPALTIFTTAVTVNSYMSAVKCVGLFCELIKHVKRPQKARACFVLFKSHSTKINTNSDCPVSSHRHNVCCQVNFLNGDSVTLFLVFSRNNGDINSSNYCLPTMSHNVSTNKYTPGSGISVTYFMVRLKCVRWSLSCGVTEGVEPPGGLHHFTLKIHQKSPAPPEKCRFLNACFFSCV